MKVAALVLIGASCLVPCTAQSAVGGKLAANTMTLDWRPIPCPGCPYTTLAHPAGTLDPVGTFVGGPYNALVVDWNTPSAGDPTGRLRVSTGSGIALGNEISITVDCTLFLQAPTGTGHLLVELTSSGDMPVQSFVDVNDDGTDDAVCTPPSPYSVWYHAHERRIPVKIGSTPLPVRVRMSTAGWGEPLEGIVSITYVPSAPNTADLGSGCDPNRVGWIAGQPAQMRDYFLAAQPGPSPAAATLVAQGYGTIAQFIVSEHDARLPAGLLGLGPGCDDLLQYVLLTDPGTSAGPGTWQLLVPPLPPGLHFFVQHASYGLATPPPATRFGASNIVRYDT